MYDISFRKVGVDECYMRMIGKKGLELILYPNGGGSTVPYLRYRPFQ
ncbi:hypothetical protein ACVWYG_001310 [Pedobacter sp. UYEF25]